MKEFVHIALCKYDEIIEKQFFLKERLKYEIDNRQKLVKQIQILKQYIIKEKMRCIDVDKPLQEYLNKTSRWEYGVRDSEYLLDLGITYEEMDELIRNVYQGEKYQETMEDNE